MVYLNEVSVGVDLPEGTEIDYFVIRSPSNPPFVAESEAPNKLPERLRPYVNISLLSTNLLAANDELRALLEPIGIVYPTCFEYNLDTPALPHTFYIRDKDPSSHRFIDIGCYTYNLYGGDPRAEAFREAIAFSGLVEQVPNWEGVELAVELSSSYTDASQLLDTYVRLLELFR